jgi:hypothetical protein
MWWPQSDAIVAVKHICAETHASNHMTDDLCVSMMLFTSCLAFTHLTCMDAHARGCVGGCGIQSCMGTSTLCNCGCSCCASTHSHLHSQRAPRLNMHRGIACPHDGMHAPKLACACIDVYMHVHALRAETDIETTPQCTTLPMLCAHHLCDRHGWHEQLQVLTRPHVQATRRLCM